MEPDFGELLPLISTRVNELLGFRERTVDRLGSRD
jgi:hypothetical protein